jgi:hypothetical protein
MKKSREHLPLYPDEETIAIEIMGARRAKDWPKKPVISRTNTDCLA